MLSIRGRLALLHRFLSLGRLPLMGEPSLDHASPGARLERLSCGADVLSLDEEVPQ